MKKNFYLAFLMLFSAQTFVFSQQYSTLNGIGTYVSKVFSASQTQAKRYEIATVGYNSYHWQPGGIIIIELFSFYYESGYEKYSVEIGHRQGAQNTSPLVRLLESSGIMHNAQISFGEPADLSSTRQGYVNKSIPIYLDIKNYGQYRIRLTYARPKVDAITSEGQIQINENPIPIDILDFSVSETIGTNANYSGNLMIQGIGTHYIAGGKLGIGTKSPTEMLEVGGAIKAREVKIEVGAGADFVFDPEYELKPLSEVEKFVQENKHLPEILSEKQMQKEGLSVNEFQMKLLQKIEELTLYVIEQDKKIKQQDSKIEYQELLLKGLLNNNK